MKTLPLSLLDSLRESEDLYARQSLASLLKLPSHIQASLNIRDRFLRGV
ncbi:hypothetical protein [Helicobacter sp. 11S02596-1]|nr:hypothetical protein [Helicobacter sp. 11S02596-1]